MALIEGVLKPHKEESLVVNPIFFRAACAFFLVVAPKVKDRFGAIYTVDNFYFFMEQIGQEIKPSKLKGTGEAYKPLVDNLEQALKDVPTLMAGASVILQSARLPIFQPGSASAADIKAWLADSKLLY